MVKLKPGQAVYHPRYGNGRVISEWSSFSDLDPLNGLAWSVPVGAGVIFDVEFQAGVRSVSSTRLVPVDTASN